MNVKEALKAANQSGINVYAMLNLYKKRSKISVEIPQEVILGVCNQIVANKKTILSPFPYFLMVLEQETKKYISQANIREHQKIKNEPVRLKITIG